jgi:hypothetical protein
MTCEIVLIILTFEQSKKGGVLAISSPNTSVTAFFRGGSGIERAPFTTCARKFEVRNGSESTHALARSWPILVI